MVLIAAGVVWYFNQDTVSSYVSGKSNTENTNQNTNATTNTNAAPTNLALQTEFKGDHTLDETVTVADVPLHFSSASKLTSFEGKDAADGQSFVVVYFDAVESNQVLAVQNGLSGLVVLHSSAGNANLSSLKVASNTVSGDRGYMKFSLPTAATDLQVIFGDSGDRFDLTF